MKKTNTATWIISTLLKSLLFAFVITLILGYILGYRAILVEGSSSEPKIAYHSVVIDYPCAYSELKVGDYITFKTSDSGKIQNTTHQIVYICPEGEYIEPNTTIYFEHCGMKFQRTISTRCQIITMLTNPSQIESVKKDYDTWLSELDEDQVEDAYYTDGPLPDCVNYDKVVGKVLFSFANLGKFLFFLRNNFLQIIVYVIIFYIGMWFLKFEPDYDKAF